MSRIEVQEAIIENLEKVDEVMLLAVQQLLNTYVKNQETKIEAAFDDVDVKGKEITSDEYFDKVTAIDQRMDNGEGTPADEVHKEAREWIRSMK